MNEAIWRIYGLLETAGIVLAAHKTKVILIISRKDLKYIKIQNTSSKEAVKYLKVKDLPRSFGICALRVINGVRAVFQG